MFIITLQALERGDAELMQTNAEKIAVILPLTILFW